MSTRMRLMCLTGGVASLALTGCIIVGVDGWCWGCSPKVWTEEATARLPIDTSGLRCVKVRTHNGSITFDGQPAEATEAYITVTKKGGGSTQADAEEALKAIEVYVERAGDETQRIGWRWKGTKRPSWGARVSFEIHAPGNLRFEGTTHNGPLRVGGVTGDVRVKTHNGPVYVNSIKGELYVRTHNGPIEIKSVAGDVRVVTHNGPVNVESSAGKLHAETHNGKIVATYAGEDITVETHNGSVSADLKRCAALNGRIKTHNGSVKVVVGADTSADLTCRTHNGSIKCDAPLDVRQSSRRRLTGRIGGGKGDLEVATHNGSVIIRQATG